MQAIPPIGSLAPHERPGWRLAYQLERIRGATRTEARAAAAKAVRHARTLVSAPDSPQEAQALLRMADAAHGAVCRVLKVDANPPTYKIAVAKLSEILIGAWGAKASPAVGETVQELLDVSASKASGISKWAKAKAKVKALAASLAAIGTQHTPEETQSLGRVLASAYRLGKAEVAGPLGFGVSFNLQDRNAVHALQESGLYWVGKHYGEAFDQPKLLETVREVMLEQGLGRAEGGRRLMEAFGGQLDRSETYWRGMAATVATRARSFGAITSMEQMGGRRYEYVNPMDEVTSDVCRALHGQTFTVAGAVKLRDRLLTEGAANPEAYKEISPWPRVQDVLTPQGAQLWDQGGLRNEYGQIDLDAAKQHRRKGASLQAQGIAWPPLHFHCRSKIVIRVWFPLSDDEPDPLGDVAPDDLAPPPKPGPKKGAKLAPQAKLAPPAPVSAPTWQPALPSQVVPGDPSDLFSWQALFRLNGFSDQEFTKMGEMAAHLVPGAKAPGHLIQFLEEPDLDSVLAWMRAYPPAKPRTFPDTGWMPSPASWAAAQEGDPTAMGQWLAQADGAHELGTAYWQAANGTKQQQQLAKLFWDGAEGGAGSIFDPDSGASYAEMIAHLQDVADGVQKHGLDGFLAHTASLAKGLDLPDAAQLQVSTKIAALMPDELPSAPSGAYVPLPTKPTAAKPPTAKPPAPAKELPKVEPNPGPHGATLKQPEDVADLQIPQSAVGVQSDIHAGFDWTPAPAGDTHGALTLQPTSWKPYLEAQGYTPGEVRTLLGTKATPGPIRLKLQQITQEAKEFQLEDGAALKWARASIPGELANMPPANVVQLAGKPPAFLSPEELGARLKPAGAAKDVLGDPELGTVYEDKITGSTWYLRKPANPDQARTEVAASALYRRLGLDAPEVRLVKIDGDTYAATPAWHGWERPQNTTNLAATHGQELARGLPADAWLGNWNVTGTDRVKIVRRKHAIPGLDGVSGGVMRTDNRGAMGFRWTGSQKPAGAWSASDVRELDTLLDAKTAPGASKVFAGAADDPSLMLPMMDRIGSITEEEIAAAVRLGGFAPGDAAELQGVLLGRARVMRTKAKELRARLVAEAAERQRQALAAAQARELARARRAEMQAALERGEIVRSMVVPGGRLEQLAEITESQGSVMVQSDHGVVRDQMVRVRRYRALEPGGSRKAAHEGFEVHAVLDSTHFAALEREIKAMATEPGASSGSIFRSHLRKGKPSDPVFTFREGTVETFLGSGRWVENDKIAIDFVGDGAYKSMRGQFRIRIKSANAKKAQRDLDAVLGRLELSDMLTAPTERAAATMRANKALWNLDGSTYWAQRDGSVVSLEDAEARLKQLGVDPARLEQRALGDGYHTTVIRDRWRKERKERGVRFLYHETRTHKGGVQGVAGLDGSDGGLIATTERMNAGIGSKGMSSSLDLPTGGASSVFTRLVSTENLKGSGGRWYGHGDHGYLIHPRALDRTDWYANTSDKYGELRPDRGTAADQLAAITARTAYNDHEIMLRYRIPRGDLLAVKVDTEDDRKKLIAWYKEGGVDTVHGQPVEQYVLVMDSPGDYSRMTESNPVHAFLMGLADDIPEGVLDD